MFVTIIPIGDMSQTAQVRCIACHYELSGNKGMALVFVFYQHDQQVVTTIMLELKEVTH